jgi:hypothetical protein
VATTIEATFLSGLGVHSPPFRSDFLQTVGVLDGESPVPQRHCLEVDMEILVSGLVLPTVGGGLNDAISLRYLLLRSMRRHPAFEFQTVWKFQ